MDPFSIYMSIYNHLDADSDSFNMDRIKVIAPFYNNPHKAVYYARTEMPFGLCFSLFISFSMFIMLRNHTNSDAFQPATLPSTIAFFVLLFVNIANTIFKYITYRALK